MKLKITVDIEGQDGEAIVQPTIIDVDIPDFEEYTGPDNFGLVFHQCEQNAIKVRNEAIRQAMEKYLAELAKKKAAEAAVKGEIVGKKKNYLIDAEIGRLSVKRWAIRTGAGLVWETDGNIFPKTGPREPWKSANLRDLLLLFPCDESYRKSEEKLQRVLRRREEEKIPARTLDNVIEREGEAITQYIAERASEILQAHHFTATGPVDGTPWQSQAMESVLPEEHVKSAVAELNAHLPKERQIVWDDLQETFEN